MLESEEVQEHRAVSKNSEQALTAVLLCKFCECNLKLQCSPTGREWWCQVRGGRRGYSDGCLYQANLSPQTMGATQTLAVPAPRYEGVQMVHNGLYTNV